eukprot:scaffold7771_cov136-Skeletonema_dohrnii-CCMP3373.AAC.1
MAARTGLLRLCVCATMQVAMFFVVNGNAVIMVAAAAEAAAPTPTPRTAAATDVVNNRFAIAAAAPT